MKINTVTVSMSAFPRVGVNCWVEIVTDSGVRGVGQSGGWGYPHAVAEVIRSFAPLLRGQDPSRIEHLWSAMNRVSPFRGNLLSAGIAAVDCALWDIKGKSLDVPVWALLGGTTRDRVRLHAIVRGANPDAIMAAVAGAIEDGYTAVKYDPLLPVATNLPLPAMLTSVREMAEAGRSVAGNDVDLIFDLHRKLDPAAAVAVVDALADYRPLYVEDPLQIDSMDTQADLGARVNVPLAVGERLTSVWEFRQLLDRGMPIVLRPDVGLAGGISHTRKIAALAEAHHCHLSPHNFLGPGITAPTLHLALSIPNLLTMEYLPSEADISSPLFDGGYLLPPQAPGLGIEVAAGPDTTATEAGPSTVPLAWDGLLQSDGSVANAI